MGGPAYHGWTHRPKSQGGTDPIDFPTSEPAIISVNTSALTPPGDATDITWSTSAGDVLVNPAGQLIYTLTDSNTTISTSETGLYRIDGAIDLQTPGLTDNYEREPELYVYEDSNGPVLVDTTDSYGFPNDRLTMSHYIPGSVNESGIDWHWWGRTRITVYYNFKAAVTTAKFSLREVATPNGIPIDGSEKIFAYMMVTRLSGALANLA